MTRETANVLLLVLDGARPDHFSSSGYPSETTPFLDQVAREGVRFPLAFTTAPSSVAAYASMLTGLFPSLHGATEETGVLGPGVPVLPELLKREGYRTATFAPDGSLSPELGFGRGFDRCYTPRGGARFTGRAAAYARRASDRVLGRADAGARRITQALLEWIEAGREPFFAVVRFAEALQSLRPPPPYDRAFAPGGDAARRRLDPARAAAITLHDGALQYLDMRVKQIADALAGAGRWDRTLFIATSAYAEPLVEPGVGDGAAALRDTVLRVPLIMRYPGPIPTGFIVEEFVQPIDILPTVAALTGAAATGAVQGRALFTPTGATAGPRAAIAEAFRSTAGGRRRKAIRTRREKFIWQSDEDNALYDLVRDPDECVNIAAAEPERADRLRRTLFDTLADAERWGAEHGIARAEPSAAAALAQREAGD